MPGVEKRHASGDAVEGGKRARVDSQQPVKPAPEPVDRTKVSWTSRTV